MADELEIDIELSNELIDEMNKHVFVHSYKSSTLSRQQMPGLGHIVTNKNEKDYDNTFYQLYNHQKI